MSDRSTLARSLHDLGLANWFGGNLMGAVGLNGGASDAADGVEGARVANSGWARFTPVNAVAVGAHLVGAAMLLKDNRDRVQSRKGVAQSSAVKTALTAAAVGATVLTGLASAKVVKAGPQPQDSPTDPSAQTPPDVAKAQATLKRLQYVVPALTGAIIVISAFQGEQQATEAAPGRVLNAGRKLANAL